MDKLLIDSNGTFLGYVCWWKIFSPFPLFDRTKDICIILLKEAFYTAMFFVTILSAISLLFPTCFGKVYFFHYMISNSFRKILLLMPSGCVLLANSTTQHHLFSFRILKMMRTVAYHKSENRMSLSALAACMAPLLLRPLLAGDCEFEDDFTMGGDGSIQLLQAAAAANHAQAIVIILLEEYENIFDVRFLLVFHIELLVLIFMYLSFMN